MKNLIIISLILFCGIKPITKPVGCDADWTCVCDADMECRWELRCT